MFSHTARSVRKHIHSASHRHTHTRSLTHSASHTHTQTHARTQCFESGDARGLPAGSPAARPSRAAATLLNWIWGLGVGRDVGVARESRAGQRAVLGREVNFELQPWTFPGGPQRTSGDSRPGGWTAAARTPAALLAAASATGAGRKQTSLGGARSRDPSFFWMEWSGLVT